MSSGNSSLAGDIAVAIGDSFSDAIVVAMRACEDLNDPLTLLQQKQIISACMSVVIHMRGQIECILDLDGIARECVGDMIDGISIDMNVNDIEEGEIGFND